ncbi:MAG: outer membrane lipoprotein-sorting protein [Bdellovibrionaceae bacterium]|nr:outer membrane lipoprotein-sorting protein [Pseudobdellovibrionaceae bacterium]
MKRVMSVFVLIIVSFASRAWADEAAALLKASDQARGGVAEGLTWDVRLQSWEEGQESDRSFTVRAKDVDALVESRAPAKFKGEVFLFNDRTMWFFKPSLRKPVAVSARQKLAGQAANGDIATTNYARDYVATVEKSEKVNGVPTKVLLLKAKSDQVTYDQIRYWVTEKSKQAVRAEFMTLQGKPFKLATFEYKNTVVANGRKLPFVSKMVIEDVKNKNNRSIMYYTKPRIVAHPAAIFNINNLSR